MASPGPAAGKKHTDPTAPKKTTLPGRLASPAAARLFVMDVKQYLFIGRRVLVHGVSDRKGRLLMWFSRHYRRRRIENKKRRKKKVKKEKPKTFSLPS